MIDVRKDWSYVTEHEWSKFEEEKKWVNRQIFKWNKTDK